LEETEFFEDDKKLEPFLNDILSKVLQEAIKIPSFSVLQYSTNQDKLQNQLKSLILKEVEKEVKETIKKIEEIYKELINGKYDLNVFGPDPKITKELSVIIAKRNRDYVHHLFAKCTKIETLNFWFQKGGVVFTDDIIAIGIAMGSNIVSFQFLKENGFFEKLSKEDKTNIIARAKRFDGEGLKFLEKEFDIDASAINTRSIRSTLSL
jgi:hypothetical protein